MPTTENNSVVGSALTANWSDLNTGLTGQVAAQPKAILEQPLQAAIEAESQSYSDQFAAARDNTTTAYILRGYLDDADKLFPQIDAEFNAASGVEATIKAFQLDRSDETLGMLGSATSLEHQQYIGQQLQEKAARERLLANASGTAFVWENLDPLELLAGWATFGGSKVLKLGKVGSAALAGAGTTVPLALADQAGKDVSTFDYVLNAAMNAGVTAMWGGAASIPRPDVPNVAGFTNIANDFLSETDKIANVNALTRDLMRNFVDDPLKRDGLFSNDNAVSFMRLNGNKADGLMYNWQNAIEKDLAETTGLGFIGRKFDLTGKFGKARDELEDAVASELARRDFEFNQTGSVTPSSNPRIGKLADQYEDMMGQTAELARDSGLPGFKDFQRRPGYFHRSWNENKMRAIEVEHGRDFIRELLTRSVMSGLKLEKTEAGTIATAILTRMDAKQRGLRADFMGALGQADSDGIAAMLKDAGVDEGTIKSVMGRIDQNLSERGRIKYGKERLPLDMTLTAVAPNGKTVRMLDMIDTDLSRVGENYMQAMTGRSALARAGYGGDDASINDFKELQRLALEGRSEEYYRKLAEFKKNVRDRFENAGQPVQSKPTKDAPTPEPKAPEPKPTPTAEPKLPKELAGASPNYSLAGKPFKLKFKSDVDKALYIVSGKGKSLSHDKFNDWLVQNTGWSQSEIDAAAGALRSNIRTLAEKAEPGELTIARSFDPADLRPGAKAAPAPAKVTDDPRIALRNGMQLSADELVALHRDLSEAGTLDNALKIIGKFYKPGTPMYVVWERVSSAARGLPIKVKVIDEDGAKPFKQRVFSKRGVMGQMDPADDTILLRGRLTEEEALAVARTGLSPETLLHEAIHAVTVNAMHNSRLGKLGTRATQLAVGMRKIHTSVWNTTQKLDRAKVDAIVAKYGGDAEEADLVWKGVETVRTSNWQAAPDEMVTWTLSNESVMAMMKYMPSVGDKTLWDDFVEAVREFLSIGPKERSALDDVLSYFDEYAIMERDVRTKLGRANTLESATGTSEFRTQSDIQSRMKQLDYLLGDFTGIRPEDAILGPYAQRAKSFAQATMLQASGLWQVAETATIAWRFGAARAGAEFIKQFPGVAGVLRKIGRDPDLYDELGTVLGLDLARDVRVRPWLRQFEPNLAVQGDHTIDRVLHYGQQAVPILNGMKFVHQWQTRVASNLAMNTLARAANGDAAALKLVQEYGLKGADWDRVALAIQTNARMNGKNARQMNWDAWAQADVDSAMNVVLRMMDDSVLFGRAGQGSSFSRSGVGQVLGQFRSFVAFAHNKLLRGTIHNSGYTGLAMMLAHQYTLTVIMVAANEFRKGEDVSFDEKGLADLLQKAVGYTAGLGFIGDAAGIVGLSGGRGGISVPITGLANAAPAAAGAIGNAVQGEGAAAAGDAVQAARAVLPFVSILPGSAALQNALQE